ncbi:hypothetical protein Pyn_23406 [Prunus yedoensis var. nudiflora]|uniref:Uncharacterized protein n=1 Tax=Prunus yedoensis var. nudiflora TaxID=2094558 RepID=A0A314YHK7_PRUYE|nr:hypothetical protein Pyn_23406 [Prunus yedoensis var. nudiflora]
MVNVFRVVEDEHQYFVNEIDLIHYNSGQELKDGIEALLLQESARLHETCNTPLIARFTFMYFAVNGDEWIELPADEMDWVDFVQHVRHICAFDVLPEIDDDDVQVFKVDDFHDGIGHFLGPVRVIDHNDIPSLEETVIRMIKPHYPESEFQVRYYSYEDLDDDSNNNDPRNIVQLDVFTLGWGEVVMGLDVVRVKPCNPPQ